MQSWREKVKFAKPVRDARLAVAPYSGELEQRVRERETASFERGRIQGEKALGEQLISQRRDLMALQTGVLQSLRDAVPGVIRESEQALVDLALEVAQKLVAGLPISAQMVEAAVREALVEAGDSAEVGIMLHPNDLELLKQANSPVMLGEEGGQRLRFIASGEVSPGGCMVQTGFGLVDGRRETKVDRMRRAMRIE